MVKLDVGECGDGDDFVDVAEKDECEQVATVVKDVGFVCDGIGIGNGGGIGGSGRREVRQND